jgi:serine/threonine-protein kinase
MPFYCIHCRSEIDPHYKACPFCGEAITDFLRRYLETPIDGKYQILARLGVGGMGEVYKVLHIHLNSIRVIKLMRAAIAKEAGAHDRFTREARMATRINHPNVAALFDFSTLEDGSRYMVWEHIEGTNLHELLDTRGPLSPRYAAQLASQTLMGLDAIHRAGIVHRDVSPENLMITRDDEGNERVKIIDLGIAKQSGEEDNKTKTGMFVGKWKYCSPEQLGMLTEGERIDGRADIYSFGIVLYEMLTGVPPFQADTPHGYLMLHSTERPKRLRDVNPTVPDAPELEKLIFRAMEKDRTKRFATAREFAQALDALAPSLPDTHGAPAPLPLASELTEEPTRVSARDADLETVISRTVELANAETIQTQINGAPPPSAAPEVTAKAPPRAAALHWAIAAVVLLAVLAGGYWFTTRDNAVDAAPQVATQTTPVAAASVIPTASGRLGINAYPWANVTSIVNVDNGQSIEFSSPLVTPTPIDLAPGKYEVTLANPNYRRPITRRVEVRPGQEEVLFVQFAEASSMPRLGGAAR